MLSIVYSKSTQSTERGVQWKITIKHAHLISEQSFSAEMI